MYHLGVPTTRSLSLILTGDQVLRNVRRKPHMKRRRRLQAPSFIRFGNFELFSSQVISQH
jgi:uncharacterized protein YdiU (UPF0061 family)